MDNGTLIRVQTKGGDAGLLFIKQDGSSVDHPASFKYKRKEYCFLAGFYYDLEPKLIDHIFGE